MYLVNKSVIVFLDYIVCSIHILFNFVGYYSPIAPPVEYTAQNPLCRFKAIGYSCKPTAQPKDGLVAVCFSKKDQDIRYVKNLMYTYSVLCGLGELFMEYITNRLRIAKIILLFYNKTD